ncbi:MAG TPA: outer membrane beta-barrel protein, partial [Flavobacterium sp.]|nr:outer membrane beta-barrel protein [Flavobacterium sp.]
MKKILFITCFLFSVQAFSQSMFGKNPYRNQQDWDQQRVHYGYFLGFSSYNFKYDYSEKFLTDHESNEILVQPSVGFNVGLVGNLRLMEYLDLRFEPGLYYTKRTLTFPHIENPNT